MFRLRSPSVVITQNEHARLAGFLAAHWGNASFDRPALPFHSFVAGVIFHDWHYGALDEFPLDDLDASERSEEWSRDWLAIHQRGPALRFADPVTEVVVKMHIRRLIDDETSAEAQALKKELDDQIDARIQESNVPLAAFEWSDRLTRFCDALAFKFFHESGLQGASAVIARCDSAEEISIEFEIETGSRMTIDPWPFNLPQLTTQLIGFERDAYSDRLVPHLLDVLIAPRD